MTHLLVSLAIALAGWLVWRRRLGFLGSVAQRRALGRAFPKVSVIVPARNEARNLPKLLDSLARLDPAPAEVIVVDDHSIDETAAIARSYGARVSRAPPLPADWVGKPWACHHGAASASGDLLLFTDADTEHAPGSLGLAVGQLQARNAGLLSIVPTHSIVSAWERLQGVFQLLLLVATGAGRKRASGERRFCIGQYLLFRRDVYEAIGGHAAVSDRVAEDLAFARLVTTAGHRYSLLVAPGGLRVRMYPEGVVAFLSGWRRNFREGIASAGAGGVMEIGLVMGWLLGIPTWGVTAAIAGHSISLCVAIVAYAATCLEIARRQRSLGRFGSISAVAYPVFSLAFVGVSLAALIDTVRRVPIQWRGRELPRAA